MAAAVSEFSRAPSPTFDRWRKRLERTAASYWLREADRVGARPVVWGRPRVENWGTLHIGDDFRLGSRPAQSHLIVASGRVEIGHRVIISYGAAISAQLSITIDDDARVGPFAVIMDSDFHVAGDRYAIAKPAPVRLGKNVAIGARVTILRGSEIGDGARVASGSVVSGRVPPGASVAGVPARPVGDAATDEVADLSTLVMRILGLQVRPSPHHGPAEIPEWDSLGSLKLLLALEETYGISVAEDELRAVRSIAGLSVLLESSRTDESDFTRPE
jgi:maltose O-acetyltransferase